MIRLIAMAPLALILAATVSARGDPMRGATLYTSRCGACHSIDSNRVGPKHRGVVGRKAGSIVDYDYSPALKRAKFNWTPAQIDRWLQGPGKLVRGTKMAFTVPDPADRAAIIAYLATQK